MQATPPPPPGSSADGAAPEASLPTSRSRGSLSSDDGSLGPRQVGYDFLRHGVDNPEPQQESPSVNLSMGASLSGSVGDRYVVALVGLPATGKTHLSRRVCQYLQFFHGAATEVFNVGNYRRKICGAASPHSFFDPDNEEGTVARAACAQAAMDDLKSWLASGDDRGRVAIFDATNSTRERRQWICAQLADVLESPRKLIFLESQVRDDATIERNVRDTKLSSPDYAGVDAERAVADFMRRIEHYKSAYEPLSDDDPEDMNLAWVKLVDFGRFISMNNIAGFLPGRLVQFLMNLHMTPRPIYLSRHGQSNYNRLGKIGGDSSLSESGEAYARDLARFVHTEILGLNADGSFKDAAQPTASHARLFTSSLQRTKLTARHIAHNRCADGWITMRPRVCPALDEIYAGVFDGMTYEEIEVNAPDDFTERKNNKLSYRYPRGESYLDVIQRLDPIVHELEKQRDPVLVVGHQGILRILLAYFTGVPRERAPFMSIPLNTVIKLEPRTYSCDVSRVQLNHKHAEGDADHEPPSH